VGSRFAIVPATPEHADALAPRMRAADVAEVLASDGHAPAEALRYAIAASTEAWAWLVDGEVGAIWGLGLLSFVGDVWTPWLLTSELVDRFPKAFVRGCREQLGQLGWHHVLVNFIDARHARALRWAKALGFELGEAVPYGPAGLPFRRITLRGEAQHV
jgi:hypothetical protein